MEEVLGESLPSEASLVGPAFSPGWTWKREDGKPPAETAPWQIECWKFFQTAPSAISRVGSDDDGQEGSGDSYEEGEYKHLEAHLT